MNAAPVRWKYFLCHDCGSSSEFIIPRALTHTSHKKKLSEDEKAFLFFFNIVRIVFLLKGRLPFLHPAHSLYVSVEQLYPFSQDDLYFIFKCSSKTRRKKEVM